MFLLCTRIPLSIRFVIIGGIGSFVGTPSELALVRMSNDKKLPEEKRKNYSGVGSCISRIRKEEGFPALFTGVQATVLRACLLSACAMGITSEIKMRLADSGYFGEGGKLYGGVPMLFIATLISSFCANSGELTFLIFDNISSHIYLTYLLTHSSYSLLKL